MEANELRIGNYVYPFDDIYLVSNKTIIEDCIQVCFKDFENTNELHPISLTEDWLLKLGFRNVSNNWYNIFANENTFNVYLFENESGFRVEIVNQSIAVLNYVHELQNLYFALTKQELTINN